MAATASKFTEGLAAVPDKTLSMALQQIRQELLLDRFAQDVEEHMLPYGPKLWSWDISRVNNWGSSS